MTTRKGVWIDHKKAVIVAEGQDTATTVMSDVPRHTRFAGGSGHPGGHISVRGQSEKRSEERNRNALDGYFDDVIVALGQVESVLILGPGEAKTQLEERLRGATARPQPMIALETTDKLTDPQIVAKVSSFFD